MNPLGAYGSQWIGALGWTLIDFVWQGALIAALLGLALLVAGRNRAHLRYGLACLALVAMGAVPVVTFWTHAPEASGPVRVSGGREMAPAELPVVATIERSSTFRALDVEAIAGPAAVSWRSELTPYLPLLVYGWLAGVLLLGARVVGGIIVLERLRRSAVAAVPGPWRVMGERVALQLGVQGPFRLMMSAKIQSPAVIGWFRPVILLPAQILTGLDEVQMRALLAHEIAHIRRHDFLVNLLQRTVETALFYHPAVWWVSRVLSEERENCCDDLAARSCGSRLALARTLLALEEKMHGDAALAMRANGGSLEWRVRRLLGLSRPAPVRHGWAVPLGIMAVSLAAATAGVASPAVDVARMDELLKTISLPAPPVRADGYEYVAGGCVEMAQARPPKPPAPPVPPVGRVSEPPRPPAPPAALDSRAPAAPEPVVPPTPPAVPAPRAPVSAPTPPAPAAPRAVPVPPTPPVPPAAPSGQTPVFGQLLAWAMPAAAPQASSSSSAASGDWSGIGKFSEGDTRRMERNGVTPAYAEAMIAAGVEGLDARELIRLWNHGVTPEYVSALDEADITPLTGSAVRELFIHDVRPAYVRELKDAGVDASNASELSQLAIHDVTAEYVRAVSAAGLEDLPVDELVQFAIHDVEPTDIAAFRDAGIAGMTSRDIVEYSIHDIRPEYVAGYRDAGLTDLTRRNIVELGIHDVTPEFVQKLSAAGYADMKTRDIVELAIHDVTPEYVAAFEAAGLADVSRRQIVEFAIHDVDPRQVAEIRALGFSDLGPKDVVAFAIHDVDADYVKGMRATGLSDVSANSIVEMAIHDVQPAYVEAVLAAGVEGATANGITELRIHGVEAADIERMKAEGVSPLNVRNIVRRALRHDGEE